jgi:CheY-like chemotaxis protein
MARILCIDDNRYGCFARKTVLEEQGYEVRIAHDGSEGLQKFGAEKIDLVIVDYIMPDMNGAEVIRRIRSSGSKIPIILHSAFADRLALDERATGADVVLQKGPREIKELLETVKRLLLKRIAKKPAARTQSKARPKAARYRR